MPIFALSTRGSHVRKKLKHTLPKLKPLPPRPRMISRPFASNTLKQRFIEGVFAEFRNVANDQKKEFGQQVNALKEAAEAKVSAFEGILGAH